MEKSYSIPQRRRSWERYIVEALATVITGRILKRPSVLRDLSVRGGCLVTNYPLILDDRIEIVIHNVIFLKNPVFKEAKVVWCRKVDDNLYQSGLDFGEDNLIQFIS
jgi:hypothetical protein